MKYILTYFMLAGKSAMLHSIRDINFFCQPIEFSRNPVTSQTILTHDIGKSPMFFLGACLATLE